VSAICIIDTSIFCEILRVPHMDGVADQVLDELKAKYAGGEKLLLPMTTILETGNHIGHNGDGNQRREAARRFVREVKQAIQGDAPYVPTSILNNEDLVVLLDELPDWASRGSGLGDLAIRHEWQRQCDRHPGRRVYIWSNDGDLRGYDRVP
jgi:hypothetical protein